MPVLIVYGVPSTIKQKDLETLVADLRAQAARPLKLAPSEVSVFLPADLVQKGLGEELVCVVEGLFEKPERTPEVRQELANEIRGRLRAFALDYPSCRKVEVIVKRFDQFADGFAMCDPRKK